MYVCKYIYIQYSLVGTTKTTFSTWQKVLTEYCLATDLTFVK